MDLGHLDLSSPDSPPLSQSTTQPDSSKWLPKNPAPTLQWHQVTRVRVSLRALRGPNISTVQGRLQSIARLPPGGLSQNWRRYFTVSDCLLDFSGSSTRISQLHASNGHAALEHSSKLLAAVCFSTRAAKPNMILPKRFSTSSR